METSVSHIGARIAAERTRAGLSQEELGSRAGYARETVSKLENGRSRPELETVVDIARALGVPVSRLVDDGDEGRRISPLRARREAELRTLVERLDEQGLDIAVGHVKLLLEGGHGG